MRRAASVAPVIGSRRMHGETRARPLKGRVALVNTMAVLLGCACGFLPDKDRKVLVSSPFDEQTFSVHEHVVLAAEVNHGPTIAAIHGDTTCLETLELRATIDGGALGEKLSLGRTISTKFRGLPPGTHRLEVVLSCTQASDDDSISAGSVYEIDRVVNIFQVLVDAPLSILEPYNGKHILLGDVIVMRVSRSAVCTKTRARLRVTCARNSPLNNRTCSTCVPRCVFRWIDSAETVLEMRQNGDKLGFGDDAPNPWAASRVASFVEDGGFITAALRHRQTREVCVTHARAHVPE